MKYCLAIYIVLISMVCFGQSNITSLERTFNQHKNKGFKVALVKSMFSLDTDFGYDSDGHNPEQEYGVLVGYQNIPAYDIGFNTQVSYNKYTYLSESLRLEANVTYGINEMIHALAGINTNTYLGSSNNVYSEIGYQAGFGANIQNFNVSLVYYVINNSYDYGYYYDSADITLKGLEMAMGVTF